MPQEWKGFTPDPEPDYSGFTPDPAPKAAAQQSRLPPPPKGWYDSVWDTAASYIPDPVKSAWDTIWAPTTNAFSRGASAVSDLMRAGDDYSYGAPLSPDQDVSGKLVNFAGSVGDAMSAPGNIALGVATGGANMARVAGSKLAPALPALTAAQKATGTATAAHGAQTIADPNTTGWEKGLGALEAVGGGLAARTRVPSRITGKPHSPVAEMPPIKQQAAPIAPTPESMPVVPGSQQAVDLVDEIKAAEMQGYTVFPPNSPVLNTATVKKYPQVATLSDGSIVINTKGNAPAPITPEAQAPSIPEFMPVQEPAPIAPQAQNVFDPNSLQGLVKAEPDFVNPLTGEIKPASMAEPGDIPYIPEQQAAPISNKQMFENYRNRGLEERPAPSFEEQVLGGNEFQPDLQLVDEPTPVGGNAPATLMPQVDTPVAPQPLGPQGNTLADWLKHLAKDEAGEFDPNALFRYFDETDPINRDPNAQTPADLTEATARAARRLSRNQVSHISRENREFISRLPDDALENFIERQSQNPNYDTEGGRLLLDWARDTLDMRRSGEITFRPHPSQEPFADQPVHQRVQRAYESTRSPVAQAAGRTGPSTPEVRTRGGERYSNIADQIRGMTVEEANNYAIEMGDDIYPEDIGPLIEELSINPTGSTRAAITYLENQAEMFERQGVRTGRGTTDSDPANWWEQEETVTKGKTLEEVEAGKKKPALERLGKMIGEERAQKLASGEVAIDFNIPPGTRRQGKKRLPKGEIRGWAEWGDSQLKDNAPDPSKPGLSTEPSFSPRMFPKYVKMVYRDAQGNPIGVLESNMDGSGISSLAVSSKLGLRRGKVAFEMLKEAFDRGITEPSGATSDFTKNLIDRVKRLYRSDSGEIDFDVIYNEINKLIDTISGSRVGQAVGRFLRDESGEVDFDRLRALFRKNQEGTITPDELAEAKKMAKEAEANNIVPPEPASTPPPSPPFTKRARNFMVTGGGRIDLPPEDILPPVKASARPPMQPAGRGYQYGPTRPPEVGPDLPGFPSGRMHTQGTVHPKNLPWDENTVIQPNQAGANPKQFRPIREPRLGPKKPAKPYVDNNPQAVQELRARIEKALIERAPAGSGPGDINKLMKAYETVVRDNPGMDDPGIIRQLLSANRALLTSWDFSAPGRQGKAFLTNKEFWNSIIPMVKAWGSKGAADLVNQSILDHPSGYFKRGVSQNGKPTKSFAETVGLELSEAEETFKNVNFQKFEKYTAIDRSSRAHTAFLNKLRSDMFAKLMESAKAAGRNPEIDLNLAKSYAKFINDATGRGRIQGKLKLGEKVTLDVNDVFFAPKNMSGQIRTWNGVLNPMRYASYDWTLRKQALRSLFAIAGAGSLVAKAAEEGFGAKVEKNPFSSDFMKIKFGKTRIDLFGGYQQFPVAAMKFMAGKNIPTTGENAGIVDDLTDKSGLMRRGSIAERFFVNRLSPVGTFVYAWMNNREFDGKPFELKRALYERTLPIAASDIYELAKEEPSIAAMLAVPTTLGFTGTQHYGR